MRKLHTALVLTVLFASQSVFADNRPMQDKDCGPIAKACFKAGYAKKETPEKKFWTSCMKPVILGQTVKGVKVDADTISACRTKKIADIKNDLKDLEDAA